MTAAADALRIRDPLAIFCEESAGGGLVVRDGKIVELVASGARPETEDDTLPGLDLEALRRHHMAAAPMLLS